VIAKETSSKCKQHPLESVREPPAEPSGETFNGVGSSSGDEERCADPLVDIPSEVISACSEKLGLSEDKIERTKAQIYGVCPAFGPGYPICFMAYFAGGLTEKALECVITGMVKGSDLSERNKELVEHGLETVFELHEKTELQEKLHQLAEGEMPPAKRDEFISKLDKNWDKFVSHNFVQFAGDIKERIIPPESEARSAMASATTYEGQCEYGQAESALNNAVESGEAALNALYEERRDNAHEQKCLKKGIGFNYNTPEGRDAGRKISVLVQRQREITQEVNYRKVFLVRAGQACTDLAKKEEVLDRTKQHYSEMHTTASKEILGAGCDFDYATRLIDSMHKLEDGACGHQLYRAPAPLPYAEPVPVGVPPPAPSLGVAPPPHAEPIAPPPEVLSSPDLPPSQTLRMAMQKRRIECAAAKASPTPAPSGGIKVVSGTYGGNCGQPTGNKTKYLAASCDGRSSCEYVISWQEIGDPAYLCKKDYVAVWQCARGGGGSARAEPEAGYGSKVILTCR
jgi:hypothetical protein